MTTKTFIAEAALARVIKQAGKYVIKKPDGSIDPKTFKKSEDAIKYRNQNYYNRQQVERGKGLSKQLGRDGDEYLKDTGTLPKKDPSGRLYKTDPSTGKTTYYNSYSDWAKRSSKPWASKIGNSMPKFVYKVAEAKAILSLSTWASIAIIVSNWYDEVDAIHAAYGAGEISRETAEAAVTQVTEEALSKGTTAIIGGKLLGIFSRALVALLGKMFGFSAPLTNWLMVAAGPVQKQITTYLVANEIIAKDIMMFLLNAPGVSTAFELTAGALEELAGTGKITADLEKMRAGQPVKGNAPEKTQAQQPSSNEKPVVTPDTPAAQSQSDTIDWLNDSPEEIERKWKSK